MKIESAKTKHEDRLMQLPNVTGVGLGEKGGRPVIKVFVTHKVPETDLGAGAIVPKTLEGWGTDVDEIGVITAQTE